MQSDPGLAEEDLKQLEVPVPRKFSSTLIFSPVQKRLAVDLTSFLHLSPIYVWDEMVMKCSLIIFCSIRMLVERSY